MSDSVAFAVGTLRLDVAAAADLQPFVPTHNSSITRARDDVDAPHSSPLRRPHLQPSVPNSSLTQARATAGRETMAYQTPDSKKEEFRKYLEKSGVIDALTKVLVGLYEEPERPPNAVDYIKRYMGAPTGIDVDALRQENEDLKKEREELRSTIDELNTRLTQGAEEED